MMASTRAIAPSLSIAPRERRGFWRAASLSALAAVMVLAGCASQSGFDGDRASTGLFRFMRSDRNPHMETLENTVQYTIVPATRAMVNAPSALVIFERNLGGAIEQRIVLPNTTTVRGDNELHIRAQTSESARLDEFDFDDIVARFGGLPTPFERVSASNLSSATDSLGSYIYATETVGTNTRCVLVLRRMGVGARPLPRGTRALDVVMRNCVNGTLEQALAPMSERTLGVVGTATGHSHSLSPHAAPRG